MVVQAAPAESKVSMNSRSFSREHSTKEGTKDIFEDMAEQNFKEKELLRKADGLETALMKMHEQHVESVTAIQEELQEYQQQSGEFKNEIATHAKIKMTQHIETLYLYCIDHL